MADYPKLAPTDALERELLLGLDFVRDDFKAYHRAHPTAMTADGIRAVIRREFPRQLAALEAKIMAPPARPKPAAPPAPVTHAAAPPTTPALVEDPQRAEDRSRIAAAFGTAPAEGGVRWDSRTQTQTFSFRG